MAQQYVTVIKLNCIYSMSLFNPIFPRFFQLAYAGICTLDPGCLAGLHTSCHQPVRVPEQL